MRKRTLVQKNGSARRRRVTASVGRERRAVCAVLGDGDDHRHAGHLTRGARTWLQVVEATLSPEELEDFRRREENRGIVYLSRVPPYMCAAHQPCSPHVHCMLGRSSDQRGCTLAQETDQGGA